MNFDIRAYVCSILPKVRGLVIQPLTIVWYDFSVCVEILNNISVIKMCFSELRRHDR